MNKEEKRKAAFERMTAEERQKAEAKIQARAEKKAAAAKAAETQNYEPDNKKRLAAKRQFLKELSLYFKAVQLGKAEYKPAILDAMKKELTLDDYILLREQYIEIIRTGFCFRTPVYTHPIKTEVGHFLDQLLEKKKEVEWGLILSLLTEGYVSKTLAKVLEKHASLIKDRGLGEFVFRFIKEIKERNGNLEEDGTVTPFTEAQKKRIDTLYDIYLTDKYHI